MLKLLSMEQVTQEGDTFTFTKATLEDWIIADELVATVKTVDTGTGAVTAPTLSGNPSSRTMVYKILL